LFSCLQKTGQFYQALSRDTIVVVVVVVVVVGGGGGGGGGAVLSP
jgi:hypothetical protein